MDSCKTCVFLKKVMCHPSNGESVSQTWPFTEDRFKIGKGSIKNQLGWVCTLPLMENFMYLDKDTGLCECHTDKE